MDAVKTPGQECSALLQGLLLCHMQGLQGGNGMDTTLVLTDSQTRREGKHGRGDGSVSADAKGAGRMQCGPEPGGQRSLPTVCLS